MPSYPLSDPRHPLNVARMIHQAGLAVYGDGQPADAEAVLMMMKVGTGKMRSQLYETLKQMEDYNMVRLTRSEGKGARASTIAQVTFLPPHRVLLPMGWIEPASTPAQVAVPA